MRQQIIETLLRRGRPDLANVVAYRMRLSAAYQDGTSVGIFLKAPPEIARQRPPLGDDDSSPAHVTVMYIGELKESRRDELMDLTRSVIGGTRAFDVRLAAKPSYFPPSDHSEGRKVAKMEILDGAGHPLHRLRQKLWDGFRAAGFPFKDSWPKYKPHMTLGYIEPEAEYDGPVPRGQWTVRGLDLWGWDPDEYVSFR